MNKELLDVQLYSTVGLQGDKRNKSHSHIDDYLPIRASVLFNHLHLTVGFYVCQSYPVHLPIPGVNHETSRISDILTKKHCSMGAIQLGHLYCF